MTRNEKQKAIAQAATDIADRASAGGGVFFGNQGVSIYAANGRFGDVIGAVLNLAKLLPVVSYDVEDPKEAVALALGVKVENLGQPLQAAINNLVYIADDTKRSYARRVPKLVAALRTFASEVQTTITVSGIGSGRPARTATFAARGVSL